MKKCIACGMPMKEPGDFAMGDISKAYCRYCANTDGSMKSFLEKRGDLEELISRTQGIDSEKVSKTVELMMKELPAWQTYFNE